MSKITMSVHRALAELKTYEDRLTKATGAVFVIANPKGNDKISGKTIDDVSNEIKGNFASYASLAENQRRIKAAVVKSNAVTIITIAGTEYTVAEAIERKAKIKYDERFLSALKRQFNEASSLVDRENAGLPDKIEKYLQNILGAKDKRTAEEIASHTELYEKRYKWELVDPCGITKKIEELEEKIISFKTEVDYALSESNALTQIEVDFVD